MINKTYNKVFLSLLFVGLTHTGVLHGQSLKNKVVLNDLSEFKSAPKSWQVASSAHADLTIDNELTLAKGAGVLVNRVSKNKPGSDLYFNLEHGDLDLDLDYMMAKGSNSGIYLQGRYEIQLLDSWGSLPPKAGDNGGIYERWDESKPDGEKGYEGYAPRQNVSKAPGLWQHLKVSFQAPRFDNSGVKVEDAKILYLWLNGILIQENIVLSGPTRGSFDTKESDKGPLRLQGDHGSVAFRNISYTSYDKPHPIISKLNYTVYTGNYDKEPDYSALKHESQGSALVLSSDQVKLANEFILKYTGVIRINEPGAYSFKLNVPGGKGTLKVNGAMAVDTKEFQGEGTATLPVGDLPFEIFYSKNVDWAKAALGLTVSGPGIREYLLSDANVTTLDGVNPILIDAPENTILRSFTDLPGNIRVNHAVAVGSAEQLHYTYDLDNGMIVQLWRGNFIDATPMWHERGDGSSRPAGSVQYFGKPFPNISKLPDATSTWVSDTTETGYKPKGYTLDATGIPTFKYLIYGTAVSDGSKVMADGKGIRREISVQTPISGAFIRLAAGTKIEALTKGLFLVDDSYYINMDDAGNEKPSIRNAGNTQELIVPIKQKLSYSIIL
jgi:hypothetical protein